MPDNLVLMVSTDTGEMAYMHSIDAAEAAALEDYRPATPEEVSSNSPEKAAAWSRMRGGSTNAHPELMSKEERTKMREAANAQTMPQVTVPVGTPVVLSQGAAPAPAAPVVSTSHASGSAGAAGPTARQSTESTTTRQSSRQDDKK